MQMLSMFSVPSGILGDKKLYALVPGVYDEACQRLRLDDPIWKNPNVFFHWSMKLDDHKARCKPHRVKFWIA